MTYSTNGPTGTIVLNPVEHQAFLAGHPITESKTYRKGIVEITVQQRIVCPNATTRAYLRTLGQKNPNQNVLNVITHLSTVDGRAEAILLRVDAKAVVADLTRYVNNVGGEVIISEIMGG